MNLVMSSITSVIFLDFCMSTPLGKNSHICDSHCEKFEFETLAGDSHKIFLGNILGDIGKTEFEIL